MNIKSVYRVAMILAVVVAVANLQSASAEGKKVLRSVSEMKTVKEMNVELTITEGTCGEIFSGAPLRHPNDPYCIPHIEEISKKLGLRIKDRILRTSRDVLSIYHGFLVLSNQNMDPGQGKRTLKEIVRDEIVKIVYVLEGPEDAFGNLFRQLNR